MAKEYAGALRDGTHDLLELTNNTNVPVLVFSAGKRPAVKLIVNWDPKLMHILCVCHTHRLG